MKREGMKKRRCYIGKMMMMTKTMIKEEVEEEDRDLLNHLPDHAA